MGDHEIDNLRSKFNIFGLAVASIGQSGGLPLLWDKDTNVIVHSFSKNHIDANVQLKGSDFLWRFTGFYGEPDSSGRK